MEQPPHSPDKEVFKKSPTFPLSPLIESPFTESKSPMGSPKKLHRRTVSMSEASSTPIQRFSSFTHSPRLRDLARRARSPSPLKRSAPVTPVGPRFWSVRTSAPTTPAPHWQFRSPKKLETVEVPESPTPSPRSTPNIATPIRPLELLGGASWLTLPRDKARLGLDLFWPEEITFDLVEMEPLCQFRNLRSLKIVGMMQSYQPYIWQAAWLNLDLDELELGMVLKPEITSVAHGGQWKLIQEGWKMDEKTTAEPVY